MSTLKMDNMLVFRNWKMLIKVVLSEILVVIVLGYMVMNKSSKADMYIPILALFLAVYPSFILSFAQKEFLNGTFAWNLPGILPRFLQVQMIWLGVTILSSGLFIWLLGPLSHGYFSSWQLTDYLAFASISGLIYIFMSLTVFRFEYLALLPSLSVMLITFLMVFTSPLEKIFTQILDGYFALAAILAVMVWVFKTTLLKKAFQRRLCDRPMLTLSVAASPTKMQSYKAEKDCKPVFGNFYQRHGGKIIQFLLDRVAETNVAGKHVQSGMWAGLFQFASTMVRNPWGFYGAILFVLVWPLYSGYLDGYIDISLDRWFSSVFFLMFAYIPVILAFGMRDQTLLLQARKSREKMGFQLVAIVGAVSLILPAATWALLKFMESSLPPVMINGREATFLAPHGEVIFAALFVLPMALLAVARFNLNRIQLQVVIVLGFYSFLLLTSITRSEHDGVLSPTLMLIVLGVSLVTMILGLMAWKKRCCGWDQ